MAHCQSNQDKRTRLSVRTRSSVTLCFPDVLFYQFKVEWLHQKYRQTRTLLFFSQFVLWQMPCPRVLRDWGNYRQGLEPDPPVYLCVVEAGAVELCWRRGPSWCYQRSDLCGWIEVDDQIARDVGEWWWHARRCVRAKIVMTDDECCPSRFHWFLSP